MEEPEGLIPGTSRPCAQQVRHADGDVEDHRRPDHVAEVDDTLDVSRGTIVHEKVVGAEVVVYDLPGEPRQHRPHLIVELIENLPCERRARLVLDVVQQGAHAVELLQVPDQEPVLPRMREVAQRYREPGQHRADGVDLACRRARV